MRTLNLDPRLLAFIAGTRALLGVGIGLLLSERIPPARRRQIGFALIGAGAATTIPAARMVFRSRGASSNELHTARNTCSQASAAGRGRGNHRPWPGRREERRLDEDAIARFEAGA